MASFTTSKVMLIIGVVMLLTAKNWKNKKGTASRSCLCGSWMNHWCKFARKVWPASCSVLGCSSRAVLGAHVINSGGVNGERIVPMCDSCNKKEAAFSLKGDVTLTSAVASRNCG
jgi:hypothetical protein